MYVKFAHICVNVCGFFSFNVLQYFLYDLSVCVHVFACMCSNIFVCSLLFVCVWHTRALGLAQGSAPPCGWHSECIITINEKVNGAFSYISIYIWTIWVHKWCLGGRGQRHSALKQRGLMCFCGHQMLWIMMRPLNANQMTLDGPWSTVPAWKLSPTDTMKESGNTGRAATGKTTHFPAVLHLSRMM